MGVTLGKVSGVGHFMNMVSKTHDWMNNALTANTLYGNSGGAHDYGSAFINTTVDAISTVGMLPAAKFTAKALWQPPLQGR